MGRETRDAGRGLSGVGATNDEIVRVQWRVRRNLARVGAGAVCPPSCVAASIRRALQLSWCLPRVRARR